LKAIDVCTEKLNYLILKLNFYKEEDDVWMKQVFEDFNNRLRSEKLKYENVIIFNIKQASIISRMQCGDQTQKQEF